MNDQATDALLKTIRGIRSSAARALALSETERASRVAGVLSRLSAYGAFGANPPTARKADDR